MKLIDVFVKQANKEIREGTILRIPYYQGLFGKKPVFEFYEGRFFGEEGLEIEELYPLDTDSLNSEVELIPPKEKKYLIKVNVRGLIGSYGYLNYSKEKGGVVLSTEINNCDYKTHFTQEEMQSIKPVREFLEDMEHRHELIEVKS